MPELAPWWTREDWTSVLALTVIKHAMSPDEALTALAIIGNLLDLGIAFDKIELVLTALVPHEHRDRFNPEF